jgi:hypothetical protein
VALPATHPRLVVEPNSRSRSLRRSTVADPVSATISVRLSRRGRSLISLTVQLTLNYDSVTCPRVVQGVAKVVDAVRYASPVQQVAGWALHPCKPSSPLIENTLAAICLRASVTKVPSASAASLIFNRIEPHKAADQPRTRCTWSSTSLSALHLIKASCLNDLSTSRSPNPPDENGSHLWGTSFRRR